MNDDFLNGANIDETLANNNISADIAQAKTTGLNIGEMLMPEVKKSIEEIKARVQRLDQQPRSVKIIPNSVIFYTLLAGASYLTYRFLFK